MIPTNSNVPRSRGALPLLLVLLLALLPRIAHCADADKAADDKPAAEKPAAPTAIPLGELSEQAEAVAVNLREIATRAGAEPLLAAIDRDLPALTREIDLRLRENARIVSQRPSLELLRTLERNWRRSSQLLAQWGSDLERRVDALDGDLKRLDDLDATWKETLTVAQREEAPPELVNRAQTVLASIAKTRAGVEAQRALALRLQSRVAAQTYRVNEAIGTISTSRDATLSRVFEKDSTPLWRRDLTAERDKIAADSQDSREAQWQSLQYYVQRHSDRVLAHLGVFLALAAFLYWVRSRIDAWAQCEAGLQRPALVFRWPVATALLLALIGARAA